MSVAVLGALLISSSAVPLVRALHPAAAAQASEPSPSALRVGATALTGGARAAFSGAVPAAPRLQRSLLPTRLRVPQLGLDAPVVRVGLASDGTLEVPDAVELPGWFELGVAPGLPGPAVIVGHVDSATGPGVFSGLDGLQIGEVVQVDRRNGSTVEFVVDRIMQVDKDDFPTRQVYGPVDRPELRLITCAGSFDERSGHYESNLVVFAHLRS